MSQWNTILDKVTDLLEEKIYHFLKDSKIHMIMIIISSKVKVKISRQRIKHMKAYGGVNV
jgi:hypothetical protein